MPLRTNKLTAADAPAFVPPIVIIKPDSSNNCSALGVMPSSTSAIVYPSVRAKSTDSRRMSATLSSPSSINMPFQPALVNTSDMRALGLIDWYALYRLFFKLAGNLLMLVIAPLARAALPF